MEAIRPFRADEFERHIELAQFAFQTELTDKQKLERKARFDPGCCLGAFHQDQLAAMLTVYPFQMWLNGRLLATGGIGGVASWPEYRRQGYVGKLMRYSLETMRARGQSVSVLAPFSFAFYRKYGWETFIERKKYTIEKRWMPAFPAQAGTVRRIAATEHIPLLNRLYEAYASAFNGMIQRDESRWRNHILNHSKDVAVVYDDEHGNPKGFLIYQVMNRVLQVKEFVHADEEARKGLWNFIAGHDSMADKVTMFAPGSDDLTWQLAEPRIQQELAAAWMIRIVDLKAFVEQYPFRTTGESHRFVIRIEDRNAAWNEGCFTIEVDHDGRANVTPVLEGSDGEAAAACDIQTLSALLAGCQPAKRLRQLGRLACDEPFADRLEAVIPSRPLFMHDRF